MPGANVGASNPLVLLTVTGGGLNVIQTSFYAKELPMRRVVIVTYNGIQLLDLAGPNDAFAAANAALKEMGRPEAYKVEVTSRGGGEVSTDNGLKIITASLAVTSTGADTLIVVGGAGVFAAAVDLDLLAELKRHSQKSRRTCSVCIGAFLLAAGGLLTGRRATTHWLYADRLRGENPEITLEPDAIYTADDGVWTSAGMTAGIDLCLALIEEDCGRDVAMRAARLLVVFLKRPGGQSQFSANLALQSAEPSRFGDLHEWMRQNLSSDLRVERLAERVGMAPRSFARLYVARVGQTPAKSVEHLRIEAARLALEDTAGSIKLIARDTGFGDDERMRRAFLRELGVSPSDYRARFSPSTPRAA